MSNHTKVRLYYLLISIAVGLVAAMLFG